MYGFNYIIPFFANGGTDSEQDVKNLIDKTEKEGDEKASADSSSSGNAFAFAKVWSLHKDDVEEMGDDEDTGKDSWAQALAKMMEDQKQAAKEVKMGRGVRRKAALVTVSKFHCILIRLGRN